MWGFFLCHETFHSMLFLKISVPLNKTITEVKLKDCILELPKCFNYICSLCTKTGSRHKTPTSSIQEKSLHTDLCVYLSRRCLSAILGPVTKHETSLALYQMVFALPQAFASDQFLSQCLMLKNDSLTNSDFRNVLFVVFYLDTMHFVFFISPLCISCS